MERIAAAEQQADRQLMESAMRKDAQEEAADKQAKAERKAEQLRYRSAPTLAHQDAGICRCEVCSSACVKKQMQHLLTWFCPEALAKSCCPWRSAFVVHHFISIADAPSLAFCLSLEGSQTAVILLHRMT